MLTRVRPAFVLTVLALAALCQSVHSQSALGPSSIQIRGLEFAVAEGWTLETATTPSLTYWPVVADWDDEGRLVVIESGGVAWPIAEHNEKRLHRVVRLVDADSDGMFDTRIVAADKLPFAEGVLCLGKDMLVSAPPNIWKLTDTDGDGVCEKREVWFDGQTITGCANDLHGPYLGEDGWIYWCKGAFAEQTHELADGSILKNRAAHIFRRRMEGGPIESVICGGMDNPVEIAFTPAGDLFFTSTFLQHPGNGRRDGIGHAVYGSVFGKDHDALDGVLRTGPLAPIMTHLGPAAPSGILCLREDSRQPRLVVAEFNLHQVSKHVLEDRTAGSFRTEDRVLLQSKRVDFHPTDVLEDASGGILVVDTGGWYDLCCPTSSVDQKVASGGIYRLRRIPANAGRDTEPRPVLSGAKAEVGKYVELLGDSRPWVRRTARLNLRKFPEAAVAELKQRRLEVSVEDVQQMHDLMWALSSIGTEEALEEVLAILLLLATEDDVGLQTAACHILGLYRFEPARRPLETGLARPGTDPHIWRATAAALGRIGNAGSVEVLFRVPDEYLSDPVFRHSIVYALLEIGSDERVAAYLADENPAYQRLAFDVLRISGSDLLRKNLGDLLSADGPLREPTIRLVGKNPAWVPGQVQLLEKVLSDDTTQGAGQFRQLLSDWRHEKSVQDYLREQLVDPESAADCAEWLEVYEGEQLPADLEAIVAANFLENPERLANLIAKLDLSAAAQGPLAKAILQYLARAEDSPPTRELIRGFSEGAIPEISRLANALIQDGELGLLTRFRLSSDTLVRILDSAGEADSRQLAGIVQCVGAFGDATSDSRLFAALDRNPAAKMLDPNLLANAYRHRTAQQLEKAKALNDRIFTVDEDGKRVVRDLIERLPDGDPLRGLQVFRSAKTNCSACHQLGYVGGNIGPELTRIGKTRTTEALLEAILYPNARIEQGFRATKVLTADGRVLNGIPTERSRGQLKLQTAADRTESIALDEIELEEPSQISVMPSGIREQLTDQQLADLLALLQNAR
jgi:putative membrane-bound dehydrogenase-like protein